MAPSNDTITIDDVQYVTVADAARLLGITRQSIHRRVDNHDVRVIDLGYLKLVAFDDVLNTPDRRFSAVDPAVRKARRVESSRRGAIAQGRAKTQLTKEFPERYRELWQKAYAEVQAERGPLPGDEAA